MKVNIFMVLLALMVGSLIFYGFYVSEVTMLLTIIGTLLPTSFLVIGIGLSLSAYPRSSFLLKITSLIAFVVFLILNIILAVADTPEAIFLIINGVLMILSIISLYLLARSRQ